MKPLEPKFNWTLIHWEKYELRITSPKRRHYRFVPELRWKSHRLRQEGRSFCTNNGKEWGGKMEDGRWEGGRWRGRTGSLGRRKKGEKGKGESGQNQWAIYLFSSMLFSPLDFPSASFPLPRSTCDSTATLNWPENKERPEIRSDSIRSFVIIDHNNFASVRQRR